MAQAEITIRQPSPPVTATRNGSGSAITQRQTDYKLSASRVMVEIDKSNDDLGRDAEDRSIVLERAIRWVSTLDTIGVTDVNVEGVFRLALTGKRDNFRLNLVEIQSAARRVIGGAAANAEIQRLSDTDCEFILSMIPSWYLEGTDKARAWLREQRDYFAIHAQTEKEREVLVALKSLKLADTA